MQIRKSDINPLHVSLPYYVDATFAAALCNGLVWVRPITQFQQIEIGKRLFERASAGLMAS